jgi:hypothetical protein
MLASVMYNLDRRVVPVYYSGCMFVLFLYRMCMLAYYHQNFIYLFLYTLRDKLVQNVYLDCTSQKLAYTLGTKTEQTYNHNNILVQRYTGACKLKSDHIVGYTGANVQMVCFKQNSIQR